MLRRRDPARGGLEQMPRQSLAEAKLKMTGTLRQMKKSLPGPFCHDHGKLSAIIAENLP
jgi:hypothetical protein